MKALHFLDLFGPRRPLIAAALIVIFLFAITLSIYSIKSGYEGFDNMNTGCPAGTISLDNNCVANTASLALDTQVTSNMTVYSLLVYYRLLHKTTDSANNAIKTTFTNDKPFLTDEQYAIFGGPPPIDLNTQITDDITLDYLIAYFKFLQATTKSVVTAINNKFKDTQEFLSESDYVLIGGPPPITLDTQITSDMTVDYLIAYFKFLKTIIKSLHNAAQATYTDDDTFLSDDNYTFFGGKMIQAALTTEGFVVATKPLKAGLVLQATAGSPLQGGKGLISQPVISPIPTELVRATSDLATFIKYQLTTSEMIDNNITFFKKGSTVNTKLGDFITKRYPTSSNDPEVIIPSIISGVSKFLKNIHVSTSLIPVPIIPLRLIPDKTLCVGTLQSGTSMLNDSIAYYKKGDTSTITLGEVNNNIPSLVTSLTPILNNINTALIYAPVPIIPVRLIPDKKLCVGTLKQWSDNFGTAVSNISTQIKNKTIINETTVGDFLALGPNKDSNTALSQMKDDINKGVTILKTALTIIKVPVVTNTVPDVIDNSDHLIASLSVKKWAPHQEAPTLSNKDITPIKKWTSMDPVPLVTPESLKVAIEKSRKHVTPQPQPVSIHGIKVEHNLLSKQYDTIAQVKPFERGVVLPKNNTNANVPLTPSVRQVVPSLTTNKVITSSPSPSHSINQVVPSLTTNKVITSSPSIKQGIVLAKAKAIK
jgi:hypothetical protein